MPKMVTLTIDNQTVTVPQGTLIVDAAKKIGNNIPVFCYHPKMEPVGMCRMCLVEIGRPLTDRATGQPVFNEDRTLCLFMEGKVYGYDQEKRRLGEKHQFMSNNDTEFCLHLYEELGASFVERLNGAFVLLICDLREKKVILANDRFHLLPVYYSLNNGALLFAPEVKAILQDENFKRELDTGALVASFAFGEFWGERTLLKRVNILPRYFSAADRAPPKHRQTERSAMTTGRLFIWFSPA